MQRHWLDWSRPLIPATATWLIERHAAGGRCDLRELRCVLPGTRAGRLLLHTLISQASRQRIKLVPPKMLTPGALVEVSVPPTSETATQLECSLAWMHVLREADPVMVAPLLPKPPEQADWPAWHDLAVKIGDVTSELAGELLSFADVARTAAQLGMEREADRWEVLVQLERRYHARLRDCGRVDPHLRRRRSLEDPAFTSAFAEKNGAVTVIGVVELNRLQRKVLAAYEDRCQLLVHAPESIAPGFDSFGCVQPMWWRAREIDVPEDQIIVADRPSDQAQAVVETLAGFSGGYRPEQIAIGLGDEALSPVMTRAGVWAELDLHDPRGRAVARSRPYRLLADGIDWLRDPRYSSFSTLLRHPDVERWLHRYGRRRGKPESAEAETREEPPVDLVVSGPLPGNAPLPEPEPEADEPSAAADAGALRVDAPLPEPDDDITPKTAAPDDDEVLGAPASDADPGDTVVGETDSKEKPIGRVEWISFLDRYYTRHLHDLDAGPWPGDDNQQRLLKAVHRAMDGLFDPLSGARQPLTEWFEPIIEVLRRAYGDIETRTNHRSDAYAAKACLEISHALGHLASAAAELQPEVDATTAVRLVLTYAAGLRIPDEPRTGQIEMLGWLDLHHDAAPAMIIAGFNDGAIPQAVSADAFLPDSLRTALGVLNNKRRYARDAYLLESIRRSRERCVIVTGRIASDGEPLTPSRLLLAGAREQLPRRILRLSDESAARRWHLPRGAPPSGSQSRFRVPLPPGGMPVLETMSVTEFGWYIRCPFRYWLKYVQRLRVVEDSAVELDALQFGSITHEVLECFGRDPSINDSSERLRIAEYLDDTLADHVRREFGTQPLPAIRIQLTRLRTRLHAFARLQARRRADGWRIRHCEYELPEESYLEIPGDAQMRITGKIDRIDQSERDGSWMIIDYKTSESGKTPERTHQQRARTGEKIWCDLQLPLYQHLAGQHGFTGRVQMAYLNLPKKADDVSVQVARWSAIDLEGALDAARDIVRSIRAGKFEMADAYPGNFNDDFANICQTKVFGGGEANVEGGAEVTA